MRRFTIRSWYTLCAFACSLALSSGEFSYASAVHGPAETIVAREVRGKITDQSTGEGIAGVTVILKGSTQGTVTDFDGNYSISVNEENPGILVFSFIGYDSREIVVGNQSTINIMLSESLSALDEFIVVGYGTKKRSNLTGAVDDINFSEVIGERPIANVTQMLQGALPNVNISPTNAGGEPGATTNINVRGIGTLTGDGGSPFILLDGLPITTSQMNAINPNDIETISVLKDAASAAIYGARGAYGVILITTKKGQADRGVQVDLSSNFAMAAPTIIPQMPNSLVFAEAYNTTFSKSGDK